MATYEIDILSRMQLQTPMEPEPIEAPVVPSGLIRKADNVTATPVSVASVGQVCAETLILIAANMANSRANALVNLLLHIDIVLLVIVYLVVRRSLYAYSLPERSRWRRVIFTVLELHLL